MIRIAKLALLALSVALPAQADGLKLRFAHQFPQNHYLWEEGGKVFVEALAETGEVSLSTFPAAQLGKDPLTVVKTGLADVVTLVPSYSPEKLPLTSVAELPGFHATTCEGVHRLWSVIQRGAPLDKAEYEPLGLHVLFVAHQPPYKILTNKKQISTLGDVTGLKLRANGAAIGNLVREAGAVPISMSSGEVYDAMSRGTVDGTLLPYYTLPIYGLEDVVAHAYEGPELGGGPVIFAMTSKGWDVLSEADKARFSDAAAKAQDHLCQYQDVLEAKDRQDALDSGKVQITSASATDLAEWAKKFDQDAQAWAQGMDAQGRAGTPILEAYRATAR